MSMYEVGMIPFSFAKMSLGHVRLYKAHLTMIELEVLTWRCLTVKTPLNAYMHKS
jgi:hypothetical protein